MSFRFSLAHFENMYPYILKTSVIYSRASHEFDDCNQSTVSTAKQLASDCLDN